MDEAPSPIGWGRAVFGSLAILVGGTAVIVIVPNWALTHLTGLSRDGRVAVTTTLFFGFVVASLALLRRLQSRSVI